tara:strand:- start:23863 stop:24156 length:294 start_codon:yes stop_codon:yes gene_type:complete
MNGYLCGAGAGVIIIGLVAGHIVASSGKGEAPEINAIDVGAKCMADLNAEDIPVSRISTPLSECLKICDDLSGFRDKKGLTHACKMGVTRYYLENAE